MESSLATICTIVSLCLNRVSVRGRPKPAERETRWRLRFDSDCIVRNQLRPVRSRPRAPRCPTAWVRDGIPTPLPDHPGHQCSDVPWAEKHCVRQLDLMAHEVVREERATA